MGVKKYKICFSNFSSEQTLRFDLNYILESARKYDFYRFKDLFDVIELKKKEIPSEDFFYAEIGDVSNLGDINPTLLNFNDRTEDKEPLFKKIEKGDIIRPKKNDILLSKIRPYLKKNILITDNNNFYYTKAFIQIRPKNINSKIIYYLLQSKYFYKLSAISRCGKGYPTLNPQDFYSIKFEVRDINLIKKNEQQILATIAPLESEIASLKATKIPETDIINKVLGKELDLDWEKLKKIDQIKKVKINFSDLPTYNDTLRFSCRWNRAVEIQKELQNQFNQCEILGNHILKTQNGCSPTCGEEGDFQILGIDSISKSTVLSFENPKFTNDKITNFDKYVIHNNDFFVSRGNTIELVSLASIAEITDECRENIFPDLMIRITFDDKVDINYLAYIFNSLVGRLYFRNVTKGKNQTMVKVSEPELKKFIIPMPPKEKQSKIATLIKEQIDAQKIIDEQILKKQQQILQIIENAVR